MFDFALHLFVNGQEIFKFKAENKNNNFPTEFGFISVSLTGHVYGFSVDFHSIDKSDILEIQKY